MEKCKYYDTDTKYIHIQTYNQCIEKKIGTCNHTRECKCGGDLSKCELEIKPTSTPTLINNIIIALTKESAKRKQTLPYYIYEVLHSFKE